MRLRIAGAELAGTALLLYVVVGSGITLDRVGGDGASRLFFHAVAVGLSLVVLIAVFAVTSGAHFNPAVTLALWWRRRLGALTAATYVVAQLAGAMVGVVVAHVTFGEPVLSVATTSRVGLGPTAAELVGTLVLVLVILSMVDQGREAWIPAGVGAWVGTMVFSSSSGGFLNPAVTVARTLTDSYTGIAPDGVLGFMGAQLLGGALAVMISARLVAVPQAKGI